MSMVLASTGFPAVLAAPIFNAALRQRALEAGMAVAAPEIAAQVQAKTPAGSYRTVAPSSGDLRGSITPTITTSPGVVRAFIGSDKPYAFWINYGHYYGGRTGTRRLGPELFFENGLAAGRERALALFSLALGSLMGRL